MSCRFAYISGGKLFYKDGDADVRELESAFGREIEERALRSQQRHEWKQGDGANPFGGGMLWGRAGMTMGPVSVKIGCVTGGRTDKKLFYSLHSDRVGGLLYYEVDEDHERRLMHKVDFHVRDLDHHPEKDLLCFAIDHLNGTAGLGMVSAEGGPTDILTEGDSLDLSPSWVPGTEKTIVFQSAGVGRNQHGIVAGYGPFCIEQLDAATGRMETLVEDPETDFLLPHKTREGDLYFIRRPYEGLHRPAYSSFRKLLIDIGMFPYRLARAIFHFLNTFSMMFSGKPLTSAGGPRVDEEHLQRLVLWGRMVDVRDSLRKAGRDDDAPSLVPSNWELVKRAVGGETETLARGVLSYDLCPDGSVVYTNGSAVYRLTADGQRERLHKSSVIESVARVG